MVISSPAKAGLIFAKGASENRTEQASSPGAARQISRELLRLGDSILARDAVI
jgi:hypothetical protein